MRESASRTWTVHWFHSRGLIDEASTTFYCKVALTLRQACANYDPGVICGSLSFLILPTEHEGIKLINLFVLLMEFSRFPPDTLTFVEVWLLLHVCTLLFDPLGLGLVVNP